MPRALTTPNIYIRPRARVVPYAQNVPAGRGAALTCSAGPARGFVRVPSPGALGPAPAEREQRPANCTAFRVSVIQKSVFLYRCVTQVGDDLGPISSEVRAKVL